MSRGQVTLAGAAAGIPVLTITNDRGAQPRAPHDAVAGGADRR
jgi:hypothetical protein